MVTELPPPPAPLVERLEASFPYEHLWASEGETPSAVQVKPEDPVRLASSDSVMADPIQLLLDRLGFFFRPLFGDIRHEDAGSNPYQGKSSKLASKSSPSNCAT